MDNGNTREPLVTTGFRISRKQRRKWEAEVAKKGYASLAEFVRVAVDASLMKGLPSPDELKDATRAIREATRAFDRVGVNLNQIARQINTDGSLASDIDDQLEALEKARDEATIALKTIGVLRFRKKGSARKGKPHKKPKDTVEMPK